MIPLTLGLVSWLLVGTAVGLLAVRLLPGSPPLRPWTAVLSGLAGAVAGGLLATFLGFGGVAGFDTRALVTATLAALLAVTWTRMASLTV